MAAAVAELENKAPKVARLLKQSGEEILGVYALPEANRRRMRTPDMLERQNRELKRRTRVVRVFPHEKSLLRLISALLMETDPEWMRKDLRMEDQPPTLNQREQKPATPRNRNLQNNQDLTYRWLWGMPAILTRKRR